MPPKRTFRSDPPWLAFRAHRGGALVRGIPFLLTFEQWWDIWKKSGHWEERGGFGHQYCMARFGDKGAYEIGNVKIITMEENLREGNLGRPLSLKTRKKMSITRTGKKHSDAHRNATSWGLKMVGGWNMSKSRTPWLDVGMSRSTWYRHQAKRRGKIYQ